MTGSEGRAELLGWLWAAQGPPSRAWAQIQLITGLHCKNRFCALKCKDEAREEKSALPQDCDISGKIF